MSVDPLKNLLRQADAAHPSASDLPPDFAPQIRRLAAQRQHRQIALAAVAIIALAISSSLYFVSQSIPHRSAPNPIAIVPPPSPPPASGTTSRPQAPPTLTEVGLWPDPVADARNDAACTMVIIARRRAVNSNPQNAAETYERTIALFPETHWASIARQELTRLQTVN